jgi:hypothetical protein
MDREIFQIADFSNVEFPTIQHFPNPTQMAIMPVIAYRGDEVRPLGTWFSISNIGIALTARHVVDEAYGVVDWTPDSMERAGASGWAIGSLYLRDALPGEDV